MRTRRAATVDPPLCADDERAERSDGPAPFPPPELPGFAGTMGQSDFPIAVCLSRLFGSSGILVGDDLVVDKSDEDLPGCRDDIM